MASTVPPVEDAQAPSRDESARIGTMATDMAASEGAGNEKMRTGMFSGRDYGTLSTSLSVRKSMGSKQKHGYDIEEISTWHVFGFFKGTVLQSGTLWKETAVMAVLYWGVFGITLYNRSTGFRDVVGKESSIRAFIAMFSTLIGLLLSFYTALNLQRWWGMRSAVENIQGACKSLTMLISQLTHDSMLLDSIHRYCRASLYLIFAQSQRDNDTGTPLEMTVTYGLLTKDEAVKIGDANPCESKTPLTQAEVVWVWLANVVSSLDKQGFTKGPPHYCALMGAVNRGSTGVTDIQAYLETPIPLGYVHLLCLMVKLHNVIITVLMALTTVMLAGGSQGIQPVGMFRTAFRAFFMPFLYNAILILNMQVSDPFGFDSSDFDFDQYDKGMLACAKAYVIAAQNPPAWLVNKNFAKKPEPTPV